MPDSGEMSLGTGVSDVQVRAERGAWQEDAANLSCWGGDKQEAVWDAKAAAAPKGLACLPDCWKHLPREMQRDAR